jgi:hypothetical protein
MGTLRAGAGKSQSRKEQFRWKIGTAPAEAGVGPVRKALSVERESVKSVALAGGIACHSWPGAEGGATGVNGARSPEGCAQQAGMAQVSASGLQQ